MSKIIKLVHDKLEKFAIVDDEDYERLSRIRWRYQPKRVNSRLDEGYAIYNTHRKAKQVITFMHKLIIDVPPGMYVDHRNGDGLDNQKSNLRLCTRTQNAQNKSMHKNKRGSKFKGVSRRGGKFISTLSANKEHFYLGTHNTEIEAALAYDAAARIHHGEFARLNFPD